MVNTIIADIVGRRFGSKIGAVANIMFGKAISIVAANDGTGKIHVFDDRLKLAAGVLGDLAAEDDGEFFRLTDGAVGIQESFTQPVQGGPPPEDHVVAPFHLRKK